MKLFDEIKPVFFIDNKMNNILNDINVKLKNINVNDKQKRKYMISKAKIFGQFVIELVFVSIPAFIGSYFLAVYTASIIGNNILSKVTGTIAKQIAKQSASSQLGGGAEVDGFNKTLTSLEINISPKLMIYVVLFMSIVLIISLLISSSSNLKKSPKELLIDTK